MVPLTDYFSNAHERVYIDLRDSKGYKNELENLRHGDSNLVLTINLKNAIAKKVRRRF